MANQNQEYRKSSKIKIGECELIGLLFIWYYSMIGVLIILGLRRRQYDKTNLPQNSISDSGIQDISTRIQVSLCCLMNLDEVR